DKIRVPPKNVLYDIITTLASPNQSMYSDERFLLYYGIEKAKRIVHDVNGIPRTTAFDDITMLTTHPFDIEDPLLDQVAGMIDVLVSRFLFITSQSTNRNGVASWIDSVNKLYAMD